MLKNKSFAKYALPILIIGVLSQFFYSELQNDQLNVLSGVLGQSYGWDYTTISNPVSWGGFAAVAFYLICGWLLAKVGVIRVFVPSTILLALGVFGVALSNGNYTVYAASMFVVRLMTVALQMGCFMLCTNWFIRYRGRVLGLVTIGSPLCNVIGTPILSAGVNSTLGLRGTYIILGVIVLAMAIVTALAIKDKPEDCALNPDGALTAPSDVDDSETITLKELLSQKESWLLIVSYGLLQFIIVAVMGFFVTRMQMVGTDASVYLPALSIGAALGIPFSYVIGWIDDKIGSIKASLILCVLYLFGVVPMIFMQPNNVVLCALVALGVAIMGGGCPTMHPCVTSYVYGRKKYQAANKWIMTIQSIMMAFAIPFMAHFATKGDLTPAYIIMFVMLVIAFVSILLMWKTPDANLADRDYATK